MLQTADKASGLGGWVLLPKEEEWAAKEVHCLDDQKLSDRLPTSPNWPSLIALYLQENYELTAIPPLFFKRIVLLQVLDLSGTSIKALPRSLPKLVALKKLLLRCCDLFMELSSQVGELKTLEELDLDKTQIINLPRDIGKLLCLRHLRVSFYPACGKNKSKWKMVIHPETLSNLSQLKDLCIEVDPADKRWDDSVEVVVKELCNLKALRTLTLYLPEFQLLQYMSSIYPSLSRFRFTVGRIRRRIISRVPQEAEAEFRNWDKCFKFVNGENIPNEIKWVLRYANSFFLDHHSTATNLSEFGTENMQRLKFCLLAECNQMETIIGGENEDDLSKYNAGSAECGLESLEYLSIYYMENLESIWRGPTLGGCMSKLKFLALHTCPQLINVFSHSLLENLVNLEELILQDCPLITSLVGYPSVKPMMQDKFLPNLKRLLLLYLPELVSISNGLLIAPKLESIGFYNCPKLKSLSKVELSSKTLKMIRGERQWWEAMKWNGNETDWGSRSEFLMSIFSPINNEEDVMTQMAEDGFLFKSEAAVNNEGQQLGNISATDYQGSSAPSKYLGRSVLLSLTLRRDLVHARESHHEIELESFHRHVTNRFQDLCSVPSDELLSLAWVGKLLDVFLCCLKEFQILLLDNKNQVTKAPMDRLVADLYERSLKALDICNAICDGIEQIRQWERLLEIVVCALGDTNDNKSKTNTYQRTLGEGHFRRAKKALIDFNLAIRMLDEEDSGKTVAHRNRSFVRSNNSRSHSKDYFYHSLVHLRTTRVSRSWSAARQLQAIGNNLVAPRGNEIVASNGLATPVYTMSCVLLFVMWALVAAIPCQDRGLQVHFYIPMQYSWAAPILSLHKRILEEPKKGDTKNVCGLLRETYQMEKCSRLLADLADSVRFPLSEEKEGDVRQRVKELGHVCEAMKGGLDTLERQVREVFHRIVRSRTEALELTREDNVFY